MAENNKNIGTKVNKNVTTQNVSHVAPVKRMSPSLKSTLVRNSLRNLDNATTGVGGYDSEEEKQNGKRKSFSFEKTYDGARNVKDLFVKIKKSKIFNKAGAEGTKAGAKVGSKLLGGASKGAAVAGAKAAGSATTASAGAATTAGGAAISPVVLVIIAIILGIICIIVALCSLFDTNDYKEENKALDTSHVNVIKLNNERIMITELYKDLIENATTEEEKVKYTNDLRVALSKIGFSDVVAKENPKATYPVLDSSKRLYLNIEKLGYGYGGYLTWQPDYMYSEVNVCDENSVSVKEQNMSSITDICKEVGTKYSIDPVILLAIIEVESGGDFHHNEFTDSRYKGLSSMSEDFSLYFDSSEEEYFYELSKRIPEDLGTCNIFDVNHRNVAKFHIEYLAKKLTGIMSFFLQEAMATDFVMHDVTIEQLNIAIPFAIAAYNQGEYLQMDFYNTYKDKDLYGNNGKTYKELFVKSMKDDNKVKYGTKLESAKYTEGYMLEKENSTYLERVYAAYEKYATIAKYENKSLSTAGYNYDYSAISQNWYANHPLYKKDYIKDDINVKYIKDNTVIGNDTIEIKKEKNLTPEEALVEQIHKQVEEQYLKNIANQYNSWMSMIDDYYLTNYRSKFLFKEGKLIPEINARDEKGKDLNYTIKHKSYIHNIVTKVEKYQIDKTFSNGNVDLDYKELKDYLINGQIENYTEENYKINEAIASVEKEYAVSVENIMGQVLKNVKITNDITSDENIDKFVEALSKYLAYTLPMYEYITLDQTPNKQVAKKTFFEHELYSKDAYTDDYVLKIDKEKMKTTILNISDLGKSILKYLNGEINETQLENNMRELYKKLYLENQIVESKNHAISELSDDRKDAYYLKIGNKYCDEYVENVIVTEMYEKFVPEENIDNDVVTLEEVEGDLDDFTYVGMTASITRELGTNNIKPYKFTSLLEDEITNFTYVKEIHGDREIQLKDGTPSFTQEIVTGIDEEGNEYVIGCIFKKTITRTNTYAELLERIKEQVERTKKVS